MRYATVCSGIEAPSCGWHPLGWSPAFFSEIEAFPSAVLEQRWPGVPNLGDMTRFAEWPDASFALLCGGTPCQSFSVAGLRAGLDDPRGSLMLTYLAIAGRYRPRWLVWENVPGVLSIDAGRAFAALLGGMGQLGYGFAYRVLDAQFFGVPQRRRRVFVVGCLGDWRAAAAVLFERHSLQGHPAPSREAGQRVAGSLTIGTGGGVGHRYTQAGKEGDLITAPDIARCVATREGTSQDWETTTMVAHSLRADGFDACEDGTGRGTPIVPIAFDWYASESQTLPVTEECPPLKATMRPAIAFRSDAGREGLARTPSADAEGRIRLRDPGFNVYEETAPTLDAGSPHGVGHAMKVRRLTPRECERLQGFPDDFTLIQYRGKPAADGPRYKALGNSMAVPVVSWIGRRIEIVEGILKK